MALESRNSNSLLKEILSTPISQKPHNDINSTTRTDTKIGSIQIIYEAKTIKRYEAVLLEKTALKREDGLIALRKNKMEEGRIALEEARKMFEGNDLGIEANLIRLTYQSASESFLHLKKNQYDKCIDSMRMALDTHKELFLNYGHVIEQRRIHLGGNIAKIYHSFGMNVESFQLLTQLILYVFLEDQKWPLVSCDLENPDKIPTATTIHVVNQLAREMGKILSKNEDEEIFKLFNHLILGLEQSSIPESQTLLAWCKNIQAILDKDNILVKSTQR